MGSAPWFAHELVLSNRLLVQTRRSKKNDGCPVLFNFQRTGDYGSSWSSGNSLPWGLSVTVGELDTFDLKYESNVGGDATRPPVRAKCVVPKIKVPL